MSSLLNHREWQSTKLESGRRSYYRAIEVGSAASLFLLWPRKSFEAHFLTRSKSKVRDPQD